MRPFHRAPRLTHITLSADRNECWKITRRRPAAHLKNDSSGLKVPTKLTKAYAFTSSLSRIFEKNRVFDLSGDG